MPSLRQQLPHNMRVQFLAFAAPLAAHGLGLLFVRDGQLQADEDCFALPDLTVHDIILVGAFIEIGRCAYLLAEAKFVFLEILVHIAYDSGRDVFAEKIQGLLPLTGDLIAGAVVQRLHPDQAGLQKLAQSLLEREVCGVLVVQEE